MIETDPTIVATIGTDALITLASGGPPGDLPEHVPEFVGELHGSIRAFLAGSVDSLGETVSGLTPGGAENAPGR